MLLFTTGAKDKIRGSFLPPNAISLGYGIFPIMSWMNMLTDIFILAGNGASVSPETRIFSRAIIGKTKSTLFFRDISSQKLEISTKKMS